MTQGTDPTQLFVDNFKSSCWKKVLCSRFSNSLLCHKEQPGVKRNLSSPLFFTQHPTLYERQQAMVHLGQTFAVFVYPDLLLRKITFSTIQKLDYDQSPISLRNMIFSHNGSTIACVQPSGFTTSSFPRSLFPRPAPQSEKRGETLGTTRALLISNKFSTVPKSFRNDFHSTISSFHPHIFLLRFSTKTVGKEAKVHRIIARYHEVARRRL